jgi:protease-4
VLANRPGPDCGPRSSAARWLAPLLVAAGLALAGCFNSIELGLGLPSATAELRESTVLGEGGPKLVLLDVSGIISDQSRSDVLGLLRPRSQIAELREALERAAEDPRVAGLLLRIQSPGGSVSASETLHHEITRWRDEQSLPVVAFLNGLAASGGYYVAMTADEVLAHPTTVTGSIGVVLPGLNFSGLMERYGVSDQTFTSGGFKDAGSSTRPMRPEERAQLQSVVDDLHQRFVEVVAAGRSALDSSRLAELADGRVLSARQALDAGLVDGIGYLDDALQALERRAGIERSRLVMYHRRGEPAENVYSQAAGSIQQALPLDFYYLWPPAVFPAFPSR